MNPVSACTFIKDTFTGAFCLFESMISLLPFVEDMYIIDLGSEDGTLEILDAIVKHNKRVVVVKGNYRRQDAGAFADVANDCIALASNDNVLFWQADEIWHQDLLRRMNGMFEKDLYDMSFWRYQLKDNFQNLKWSPHPVHRVGPKDNFKFVADGMNTDRVFGTYMCSSFDMGWFTKWGNMDPMSLPVNDMILDVSRNGGFIDNIVDKSKLHAPMWHEAPNVNGKPVNEWYEENKNNTDWYKDTSPFNVPHIMKAHLGKSRYALREQVYTAIMSDNISMMKELIGYEN